MTYAWLLKHAPQLIAGLIVAGLLAWGAHSLYEAGGTSARLACAEEREDLLEAAMADLRAANAERDALSAKLDRTATQYEKERADALATADRVAADLRAGNLKLRNHWAGCATDGLAANAENTRIADDLRKLREASVGRIIAIGAEADAKERALQDAVRAYEDAK